MWPCFSVKDSKWDENPSESPAPELHCPSLHLCGHQHHWVHPKLWPRQVSCQQVEMVNPDYFRNDTAQSERWISYCANMQKKKKNIVSVYIFSLKFVTTVWIIYIFFFFLFLVYLSPLSFENASPENVPMIIGQVRSSVLVMVTCQEMNINITLI